VHVAIWLDFEIPILTRLPEQLGIFKDRAALYIAHMNVALYTTLLSQDQRFFYIGIVRACSVLVSCSRSLHFRAVVQSPEGESP
jgi:hypothetical protein